MSPLGLLGRDRVNKHSEVVNEVVELIACYFYLRYLCYNYGEMVEGN